MREGDIDTKRDGEKGREGEREGGGERWREREGGTTCITVKAPRRRTSAEPS